MRGRFRMRRQRSRDRGAGLADIDDHRQPAADMAYRKLGQRLAFLCGQAH